MCLLQGSESIPVDNIQSTLPSCAESRLLWDKTSTNIALPFWQKLDLISPANFESHTIMTAASSLCIALAGYGACSVRRGGNISQGQCEGLNNCSATTKPIHYDTSSYSPFSSLGLDYATKWRPYKLSYEELVPHQRHRLDSALKNTALKNTALRR